MAKSDPSILSTDMPVYKPALFCATAVPPSLKSRNLRELCH